MVILIVLLGALRRRRRSVQSTVEAGAVAVSVEPPVPVAAVGLGAPAGPQVPVPEAGAPVRELAPLFQRKLSQLLSGLEASAAASTEI